MIDICLITISFILFLGRKKVIILKERILLPAGRRWKMTKWEYKIVDHSNSTSMGYSNEETEAFKIEYKDAVHWKYEMSMIELNKLGQDGWELVTQDGASQIYLRRPL